MVFCILAKNKILYMLKSLKTFRQDFYILLLVSLVIIFIMEIYSIQETEIFKGAEIVGAVVLKLCYSIMASIVFYFFSVHLREEKKRKQILNLLINHFDKLKSLKDVWFSELYFIAYNKSKGELDWPSKDSFVENYYPSSEEIAIIARCTPLTLTRSGDLNWIDRINTLKNEIQPLCEEIFLLSNNLKGNEISLIGQLKTCQLFLKISVYKFRSDEGVIIANENLSFIEPELVNFLSLFKEIELNIIKKIK